jgi:hypothetical protein
VRRQFNQEVSFIPSLIFHLPCLKSSTVALLDSLAFLIEAVNRNHVLVTVGHVLDGKDASTCGIEININDPTQAVQLHLVDEFRREFDDDDAKRRPRFRGKCPYNPCLDEICLISTDGLPNDVLLNCQFQLPIDCNFSFTNIPN